jgi:beta-galactosidase
MRVILATPSGGKPNWLGLKYPEVRRVAENGSRDPQKGLHNHCLTSPIYRRYVREINTRLAERYGKHPSLALWHVSNEFGGYCYCELCMAAFREWLAARYCSLDALNENSCCPPLAHASFG